MSTTQFTQLLTQSAKLDQRIGGTCSTEKFKACEELVSTLDKLVLSQKPGKQKIACHALYASASIISNNHPRPANAYTEKATPSHTWQQPPKAQHGKNPAISP